MKTFIIALLAVCGLSSCTPKTTIIQKEKTSQDKDTLVLQPSEQTPIQNYEHCSHRSHYSHYSSH